MTSRQALVALAALLVVAGLVLGLRTISTNGIGCGSVFSPSSTEAGFADGGERVAATLEGATPDDDPNSNAQACDSAVGDAKPFAYGAIGLGVLALIGSLLAPSKPTGTAPTA